MLELTGKKGVNEQFKDGARFAGGKLLTPTQNNSENETRLRLKQYPHEITHILSKSEAEPLVGST